VNYDAIGEAEPTRRPEFFVALRAPACMASTRHEVSRYVSGPRDGRVSRSRASVGSSRAETSGWKLTVDARGIEAHVEKLLSIAHDETLQVVMRKGRAMGNRGR
jgi:hypothetical protein